MSRSSGAIGSSRIIIPSSDCCRVAPSGPDRIHQRWMAIPSVHREFAWRLQTEELEHTASDAKPRLDQSIAETMFSAIKGVFTIRKLEKRS